MRCFLSLLKIKMKTILGSVCVCVCARRCEQSASVLVNLEEEIRYFSYCSLSHLIKKVSVTDVEAHRFGEV